MVEPGRGTEAGDAPAWRGDEEPDIADYSGDEHLAGEAKRNCEAEHSSIGPNWAAWIDAGFRSLAGLPFSPHENLAALVLLEVVDDPRDPALGTVAVAGGSDEGGLDLEGMVDFGLERLLDGTDALAMTRSRR